MNPLLQLPNTYRAFFGGFSGLNSMQKQLVLPILNGNDIVLQAGTGSGKTEAALAPATENLLRQKKSYTIIYIVPTRALALDINRRMKPLYKRLGLNAGIRTGDAKQHRGSKPHLLIMTPESLDVMLGSQDSNNRAFLQDVRTLVIDEVHMFLHNNRGYQLSYLLKRLKKRPRVSFQTIAMSATLCEPKEIVRFFNFKDNAFFYVQPAKRTLNPYWICLEDKEQELAPFFDDLYQRFNYRKILVFSNSRKACETIYDLLKQNGLFSKNLFVHYSNLSTKERRLIETSFREKRKGLCIATSTLELGIDIGDVDGVVLMGPPPSTMSFLQRIGRGNRRQSHINFWGICEGKNAGFQLLRFLALFELAEEGQVEAEREADCYSVQFQQILSYLWAKKQLSLESLKFLFKKNIEDLRPIFHHMVSHHWLKPTKQGLYEGGWRYWAQLKKRKIWSNFPPTEEDYDVILEQEVIADVPLSIVKQLRIGNLVQLTGKILKILQIEEKEIGGQIWVEESHAEEVKELLWIGVGPPTPYEVAQKMGKILLEKENPPGLLNRTAQLLEKIREQIAGSIEQQNGIRVYRQADGTYRFETFLGTAGNFILHHLIQAQCASNIEGLSVHFDELGIVSNEWIPFDSLEIPYSLVQLQAWLTPHSGLLRSGFSWNHWLYKLPDSYQEREISCYFLDPRILKAFQRYHSERTWLPLKENCEPAFNRIEIKGEPWSWKKEKMAWGNIVFPKIPSNSFDRPFSLTATQVQGYVSQKLCSRWAAFQQAKYTINPHPRFQKIEREMRDKQKQALAFKQEVMVTLQRAQDVRRETDSFSLKEAIQEAINGKKTFFLVQAKLNFENRLKGIPDLIYLKNRHTNICLEVWDIKYGNAVSYAQKWRVAFYAHLLKTLLKEETFSLPVEVSGLGGVIHPRPNGQKTYAKEAFSLSPYQTWMPRLIEKWTSRRDPQKYVIEPSCTSCQYFSCCYQETLFHKPAPQVDRAIVQLDFESNDFPKNTKQWFFIQCTPEKVHWQIWENHQTVSETCISFQESKVVELLQEQWTRSVLHKKNPHILVYEPSDRFFFQSAFPKFVGDKLSCCTAMQTVLQTHFIWPVPGNLTAAQVAACLGLPCEESPPLSLYHKTPHPSFDLLRQIWSWCLSNVKSRRTALFEHGNSLISSYLEVHHRETELKKSEILEFQRNPFTERVNQFRAIGPVRFIKKKRGRYHFTMDSEVVTAKFREGDFLKLSPIENTQIQEGYSVILENYSPCKGALSVRPLSGKMEISQNALYVLDENAEDWNAPKVKRVLNLLKDPHFRPGLVRMLFGHGKSSSTCGIDWLNIWYESHAQTARLNPRQKQALMLPFQKDIGLIEGPPGTGKTHVLVWTVIALMAHAEHLRYSLKILITAQTHHAIDQILKKIAKTASSLSLYKHGRCNKSHFSELGIQPMEDTGLLTQDSSLILGSTGFGIYQLLESKNFPQLFDWVIFDESSQVLTSSSLLSLIFGKGKALFYGDTQQLSPVLKGNYAHAFFPPRSILEELILRHSPQNRIRLEETYRMNSDICRFASDQWYNGELFSCIAEKDGQLKLSNYPLYCDSIDDALNPSQSMTVIPLSHTGCLQFSQEEAKWIAHAVKRLVADYAVPSREIGIISPHRLQNNTLASALKQALPFSLELPKIDTVERMQGAEFDVVIFSATVSDETMIHSPFLKNYRRFNVALTRARKKFILVASELFFESFPETEEKLIAQVPFEKLVRKETKITSNSILDCYDGFL